PGRRPAPALAARRTHGPARRRLARALRRDHGRAAGRRRPDPGRRTRPLADPGPRPGARRVSRLLALLGRETALAWGGGGGPLVAVGFYAGVVTMLPLAIGPDLERLAGIAPAAAFVALALSSLLSLERMFE